MKAFVVERYGKDGVRAADVPEPEVGERDVLVKLSAASISPLDKMVRDGEFKRLLKYSTSFVLGHDGAGVVSRVGSAAHFAPDGSVVIEYLGEGAIWPTDLRRWQRYACQVAGRDLTQTDWSDVLPDRDYRRVCSP